MSWICQLARDIESSYLPDREDLSKLSNYEYLLIFFAKFESSSKRVLSDSTGYRRQTMPVFPLTLESMDSPSYPSRINLRK